MRTLLVPAALLSIAALAPAQTPPDADGAVMLRLRDGSFRWGSVSAHDPEGLVFTFLENGGVARLSWSLLDPEHERELKTKLGYVDLTGEDVLIDADRIVTTDGTEFIGRIVDRTEDSILIKTAGATIPIPKNRIAGAATTIQVRALEVFTKDELYDQQVLSAPPADAAGHFALAQYCERNFDFARALEHYTKAAATDPAFRTGDVKLAVERATAKAKAQKEIDYLSDVDLLLARRKYDQALTMADAFKEKFPSSTLIPDAKKKHDRIVKARDRDVADRVARMYFTRAGALARTAALKTLEEALSWLEETMKKELLAAVAKEAQRISKDATEDTVRQTWAARRKTRWNQGSYGLGTWLLGKDGALKGSSEEKPKEAATEKDKERADLEAKIKRFLENQEMARKAKSSAEQKDDREEFWKEFPSASRAGWILAWYAEHSGDFDVAPKPNLAPCRECGGKGTREIAVTGGNVAKSMVGKGQVTQTLECEACHGIGVIRRIAFR